MSIISRIFGRAGKGLGHGTGRVDLATALRDFVDDLNTLAGSTTNGIVVGLAPDAPTTGNSQATGTGATVWNINLSAGTAVVNSVSKTHAAQADISVHSATQLVTNGQSCYAWLIEKNASGTVTTAVVKGTAATTGTETIPTDAAITTGASTSSWIKLALLRISRTADTTVSATFDPKYRQLYSSLGNVALKSIKG